MRGSFLLRRIFSSVSLRRRTESRFHIFIPSPQRGGPEHRGRGISLRKYSQCEIPVLVQFASSHRNWNGGDVVPRAKTLVAASLMTQGPDIRRNVGYLVVGELRPAFGGHGTAEIFRPRHALGYNFRNAFKTAITPQPFLRG